MVNFTFTWNSAVRLQRKVILLLPSDTSQLKKNEMKSRVGRKPVRSGKRMKTIKNRHRPWMFTKTKRKMVRLLVFFFSFYKHSWSVTIFNCPLPGFKPEYTLPMAIALPTELIRRLANCSMRVIWSTGSDGQVSIDQCMGNPQVEFLQRKKSDIHLHIHLQTARLPFRSLSRVTVLDGWWSQFQIQARTNFFVEF